MNVGAERVGYIRNGDTQWAWIGPMSPWPTWALVPADAMLTVGAHFEASRNETAKGFGDLYLKQTTRAATDAYIATLARAGWMVETARFDTIAPELPPRPLHLCMIEARQGSRSLRLTLERAVEGGNASLYWAEGPVPVMLGSVPGPC